MRSIKSGNFFKTGTILFFLTLIFLVGVAPAKAFQKKADTVSTSDIQFTSIPTKADKIAAAKKAPGQY